MNHELTTMKKYTLKPGKHQFAPNSPPVHSNDNLSDEEAEWYLERYPHIKELFSPQPPSTDEEIIKQTNGNRVKRKRLNRAEISAPPSGGKGGI
jgi:hypothetical protein